VFRSEYDLFLSVQALVAKNPMRHARGLPAVCVELLETDRAMKSTQLVYIKKKVLRQSRLSLTFWGGEQEDALEWDQVLTMMMIMIIEQDKCLNRIS
jgi:hypothetical protein